MPLYTAEQDAVLADLFADDPDVPVLPGDGRASLPPHGPFDLVFVAGGGAKDDPDAVLRLAAPGATLVMDDFSTRWPGGDEQAERWLARAAGRDDAGTGRDAQALVGVVRRL